MKPANGDVDGMFNSDVVACLNHMFVLNEFLTGPKSGRALQKAGLRRRRRIRITLSFRNEAMSSHRLGQGWVALLFL